MKRAGVFLMRGLIGLVVLALVLAAGGAYYFKSHLPDTVAPRSFPQTEGEIALEGLDGPVDIHRDPMGIPHIYASTRNDLFFAQGYVHAQERFWQMDTWRHIGSGTLSEMFGESQVETDAFLRTLGWHQVAELEYAALGDEERAILDAYVEGVNAYLRDHDKTALSLEYAILGLLSPDYEVKPWTPVHSLTWGKAMAWDLRGNMDDEIERAVLLKNFTPEQVAELFPAYPSDHPSIVRRLGGGNSSNGSAPAGAFGIPDETLAILEQNVSLLDHALGPAADGIGSNSWAVSGSLTSTGMPLLANDPHLGIQMPSIWYQAHLECRPKTDACPYNVAGFTFAGVPGVVIGHNERIAWGLTNLGPDVMDLYIEKVNPEDPDQYEVNGEWVDFETRTESIEVVGGEPVEVTVRSTRHGPVISGVFGPLKDENTADDPEFVPFRERAGIELPEQYAIALRWTALEPSTPFEAIWGFNKAGNWEEFREAARQFHVPAQNLLYADVDGNIGYQAPGDIPIRARGDGTVPVPGWTDEYEWTGLIPFEELPFVLNPEEGYIVTANNRSHPSDYAYLITQDWDHGFRARRIVDLLESAPVGMDVKYIQVMQADSFNANGPVFVPLLTGMNYKAATPAEAIALDILQKWDYQNSADSSGAAVFSGFWRHLMKNTFHDQLPERYRPSGGGRWFEVLRNAGPESIWWDDITTVDSVESREDVLKKSFVEGVAELEGLLGDDPGAWRWGDLHTATFRNGTLGESGVGLIEALFNRGPFPTGGGSSIVNATGWDTAWGYEVTNVPSMRMIVDLGDLNNSLTVHTTGQSGHAYHPQYADMAETWARVEYYPMLWDANSVATKAEGHVVLLPAGGE